MTITFYDIPSKIPGKAWSPNTFKTRYVHQMDSAHHDRSRFDKVTNRIALNFKGIPYTTGAAPVNYFILHASRDSATAVTTDTFPVLSVGCQSFTSVGLSFNFSKTDKVNLSMSRSVTSQRLATNVGLNIY